MGSDEVLFKGPCPSCGSSDACANYSDGHTHCFSCGDHKPTGQPPSSEPSRASSTTGFVPIEGEIRGLKARGLSEATCAFFGYRVGTDPKTGKVIQLAPYTDQHGRVVAQKWRDADKKFGVVGKLKDALPLYGQHLWRDGGKKVVITEGEIDAMTVSQLQGNKWPVVSLPNGAQGGKKAIQAALEWLERFEQVILMFDQDEPGREAVEECAPLFSIGKCHIARLPLKDANEMLQAGRGGEVVDAIWAAKPYRPDGVCGLEDLIEKASEDIPWGRPWFLGTLDKLTFGRRDGDVIALGAGTGVGKTDFFTQSIAFDILTLGLTVGVVYLEQPVVETARRVAGKAVGKLLHVPGKHTAQERREALASLPKGKLHLYDSFGSTSWENVRAKIRYMVVGLGCKHIYLDHLTALVAGEEEERKTLDLVMAEMAELALSVGCTIHFISHLTRPEGRKPHEEGGRVQIRHFRGSNAIGMWSHFMLGLERNQQADGEDSRVSTLRVLKDRFTGQATGKVIHLAYAEDTGLLSECEAPKPSQFKDRTGGSPSGPDEF